MIDEHGPEPMKIVNLLDREDLVKEYAPGVELVGAQYGRGIQLRYMIKVTHDYVRMPSEQAADEFIASLVRELRKRAGYDLGIKPIIDDLERKIRQLTHANEQLAGIAQARAEKIVELQNWIEDLKDEIRNIVDGSEE